MNEPIAGDLSRTRNNPDPMNQRVRNLEGQISRMQNELDSRKKKNYELREELQRYENNKSLNEGGSLLIEKDRLKSEVQVLVKELVKKNDNLRRLTATYKMLLEENETLSKEVAELEKNEPAFDKTIEDYSRAMEEYENLRNALDENEFMKHEQLFITQMKLEENSRKQMELQVREIAEKMSTNKELAKQYLKKYVQYLEEQLATKGGR